MDALTIDRAALRYRLPESRTDLRRRLDRVRERLFEHALEAALVHEGVVGHELLCIRTLRVALRVPEQLADTALLDRWVQSLSRALGERIREADPRDLVRYGSPIAALTDMGRSLAREDRRRAWAWCSLGLIRADELGSTPAGLRAFMRALLDRPQQIVAVLVNLARSPELALRLARMLPRASRLELVDAALLVHGIDAATRTRIRTALTDFAEPTGVRASGTEIERPVGEALPDRVAHPSASAAPLRSAITVLVQSLIDEQRTIDELAVEQRELVGVFSVLALVDAAPMTVRDVLARELADVGSDPIVGVARRLGTAMVFRSSEANARSYASPLRASSASLRPNERTKPTEQSVVEPHSRELVPVRAGESTRTAWSDEPHSRQLMAVPESERARTAWRDEPLDARVRGTSEWAGLVLLLAIFRREQLWKRLAAIAEVESLDSRLLLHAFARGLAPEPISAEDPALLAFVGLPPDAELDAIEPGPLRERLAEPRAQLISALERCLPARDYRPSRGEPLLGWLLYRHGEVLAEPGWLELRLRLREVDTDIRRAGLDLDPDWLPELGVVVKLVYV